MKKTFKLWFNIFTSPTKGFTQLNPETPILLPLVIVLLLVFAGLLLLVPILGSDSYIEALSRVQVNTLNERGTEMSAEQIEMMQQQLQSDQMKTITILSSTLGGAVGNIIMLVVLTLLLLILTRIFKEKPGFRHLFRILIFLTVITAVQMIVKNGINLLSNFERMLSRVQYTADLQWALTSPVSLAALFSPAKLGSTVYAFIDSITDIFNWIYYIYLYYGLKYSANLPKKKALIITIIFGLFSILIGLVMTLFI